MSKLLGDDTVQ